MKTQTKKRLLAITGIALMVLYFLFGPVNVIGDFPNFQAIENERLRPVVVDYAGLGTDQDWFKSESVEITKTWNRHYPIYDSIHMSGFLGIIMTMEGGECQIYDWDWLKDSSLGDTVLYYFGSAASGNSRAVFEVKIPMSGEGYITQSTEARGHTVGSGYDTASLTNNINIEGNEIDQNGYVHFKYMVRLQRNVKFDFYAEVWDFESNTWETHDSASDGSLIDDNYDEVNIRIDALYGVVTDQTDYIRSETRYTTTADSALKRIMIPIGADSRPYSISIAFPEQWIYSHSDPDLLNVTDSGNNLVIYDIPSGLNELMVYWIAPDNIGYIGAVKEIGRYSFEVAPTSIGDASSDSGLGYEIVAEGGSSFHFVHDATENQSYKLPLNLEGHFYTTFFIWFDDCGSYSGNNYALNISYYDVTGHWRLMQEVQIRGSGSGSGGSITLTDSDDSDRWEIYTARTLYTTPDREAAKRNDGWNIWVQVMDKGAGWTGDVYLDLVIFYELDFFKNDNSNNIKGHIIELTPYGFFNYANGPFDMTIGATPTNAYDTPNVTDSEGNFLIRNDTIPAGLDSDFRIWVPNDDTTPNIHPISSINSQNLTFTSAALYYYSRDYYRLEVTGEAYSDTYYNISIEGHWTSLVKDGDLIAINDTIGDHTFILYSKARYDLADYYVYYWFENGYNGIYTVDASTRITTDTTGGGTTYTFTDFIGTGAGYILVAGIVGLFGLVLYNERKRR